MTQMMSCLFTDHRMRRLTPQCPLQDFITAPVGAVDNISPGPYFCAHDINVKNEKDDQREKGLFELSQACLKAWSMRLHLRPPTTKASSLWRGRAVGKVIRSGD